MEIDPDIPRWQYRVVSIGSFFAGDRLGVAPSYFGQTGTNAALEAPVGTLLGRW